MAPEDRCSEYKADESNYSPSVAPASSRPKAASTAPTGAQLNSVKDTITEYIPTHPADHDSGLCDADTDTKYEVASDLTNPTLASPSVNRHQKVGKDAAEWPPELNQCCYTKGIIQVRLEFGLTIDRAQADAPATLTHHFRAGATITPTADHYQKRPDPSKYTYS